MSIAIKKIIIIICLLITGINVFCINIFIANLNIYREDINVELNIKEVNSSSLLYEYIKKKDFEGLLKVKSVSNTIVFSEKTTKSTIEASELCELLHIDYLLYGFIKKANNYYNAEIRLFDNAQKKDIKVIYVKTELTNIEEVVDEAAEKFTNYMYNMLGLSEYHQERKVKFGGIGIYNSAGYWFPISTWWNIMTGLVCFESGVNVMPVSSIAKVRNFNFSIRFGFLASYGLGLNKSGYLRSYFNSILFKIPAEFCFEIFFSHVFVIGMGPQLQLDILYQERLFDDPKPYTTVAFSLFANAGYEYWFGKNKYVGLGVNNLFNFTFYNNMFIDYRIELYTIARISLEKKEKKRINVEKEEKKEKEELKTDTTNKNDVIDNTNKDEEKNNPDTTDNITN